MPRAHAEKFSIDRERFLLIVAAITAQSCGKANSGVQPIVVEPVAPHTDAPPSDPILATPPVDNAVSTCESDNDAGDVDCSRIAKRRLVGPACEAVASTCDLLRDGRIYRARAASAAAACFTRLGGRICDITSRKRCYEEGIKTSCPEPKYEADCQAKMDACKAAKEPVRYTKEECMKVMSSLNGGDQRWALSAMGPSAEGTCRLMYTVF